jgi:hypothetical protein
MSEFPELLDGLRYQSIRDLGTLHILYCACQVFLIRMHIFCSFIRAHIIHVWCAGLIRGEVVTVHAETPTLTAFHFLVTKGVTCAAVTGPDKKLLTALSFSDFRVTHLSDEHVEC